MPKRIVLVWNRRQLTNNLFVVKTYTSLSSQRKAKVYYWQINTELYWNMWCCIHLSIPVMDLAHTQLALLLDMNMKTNLKKNVLGRENIKQLNLCSNRKKKNRETDWSRFYKTHLVAEETPPLQGFLKRMPVQYGFIENFTITMLSSCHNDKQNLLPF